MKKFFVDSLILVILFQVKLTADEGMWLLPLIEKMNMTEMREMGCEISDTEIYSINHSSLKDAIVIFGPGCTGELVSENGLLFTNHHCGYSLIQSHSTIEHDYLQDGFWAATPDQELANPGLEVRFLLKIEDVTDKILNKISDTLSGSERRSKIDELAHQIENEASDSNKLEAIIQPYYAGNKYFLSVYQVYRDVRLVGAPPSSIGKFGFDADNWEWPRHTGDFSIFRIYTAPDGKPSEYDPQNIPLKSKNYLSISMDGIKQKDFTMILGYPGTTDRFLTSYGIQEILEETNPNRIKIRSARQDILKIDMQTDPRIGIQYASKYSLSSNYWKFSIGQNIGIKKLQLIEKKRKEEMDFQNWTNEDTARKVLYGNVLKEIESTINNEKSTWHNLQYIDEALFQACEILSFAYKFNYLNALLEQYPIDEALVSNEAELLKSKVNEFYKDYNPNTDIRVVKAMLKVYKENTLEEDRPDFFKIIDENFKGDIDKFVDKKFHKSIFSSKESLLSFLEHPTLRTLAKDPDFLVARSILVTYYNKYYDFQKFENKLEDLQRIYVKGIMEMKPDKKYYSDANFTMRLSYGSIEDYAPRDAIQYKYFTTLNGIMEKEDSSNNDFKVPLKLKDLYRAKDYGPYSDKGIMPVCFITDNDITGGNSGSPVLNSKGEMIGLAFDGNWEAMSGNIVYEPELQRCICVDIRYILFIIDKFAGAKNILNELKILPRTAANE